MPDTSNRKHSLLLLQRLLSLRPGTSPFTLLLDTLEQSSKPLLKQYISRATASKIPTIYLSFSTPFASKGTTHFLPLRRRTLTTLASTLPIPASSPRVIIIDTLHPLLLLPDFNAILTTLISPTTSLIATYHLSQPLSSSVSTTSSPYSPDPLTLLTFLATTIVTLSPLSHVLAKKAAEDRATIAPKSGLFAGEEGDGILVGLGANSGSSIPSHRGIVVGMEHRRKSGRGTTSEFILNCPVVTNPGPHWKDLIGWDVLEMHPAWRVKTEGMEKKEAGEGEDVETTFKLGLTEKERRDREGVILPYFDAQKGDGPGEGGRILYEYGEEDVGDWDSEEDEM